MPVLGLNLNEATLVVDALMEGRSKLMKDWGRVFQSDAYAPYSHDDVLNDIDCNIVTLAEVRQRLQATIKAERQRINGAWHRTHGWLHPVKHIEDVAAAIAAGETTREEVADVLGADLAEVDAENERDFERLQPGTWTTLPPDFGYDVVTDWPSDATEPASVVTAGIDTQADGSGKVRIDLSVGGTTATLYGSEELIRHLASLVKGY